jgi:uncharacterized membrane protein YeaQ/YmgE (transglycosylase-associated protein family)
MIYHTRSQHTNNYTTDTSSLVIMIYHSVIISVLASSVVKHDYNAGSISSVIISVLASSVVNDDYKAGSISSVIISILASSVVNHDCMAGSISGGPVL